MRLLKSPNNYSCLPTAFAMALDLTLEEVYAAAGHDGSERYWPELPEPLCYRTFHVQELVAIAWKRGIAVTQFDFTPMLSPDGVRAVELDPGINMPGMLNCWPGVLLGRGLQHRHAVAWDREYIYDPKGLEYRFDSRIFTAESFLAFSEIKSK